MPKRYGEEPFNRVVSLNIEPLAKATPMTGDAFL